MLQFKKKRKMFQTKQKLEINKIEHQINMNKYTYQFLVKFLEVLTKENLGQSACLGRV